MSANRRIEVAQFTRRGRTAVEALKRRGSGLPFNVGFIQSVSLVLYESSLDRDANRAQRKPGCRRRILDSKSRMGNGSPACGGIRNAEDEFRQTVQGSRCRLATNRRSTRLRPVPAFHKNLLPLRYLRRHLRG